MNRLLQAIEATFAGAPSWIRKQPCIWYPTCGRKVPIPHNGFSDTTTRRPTRSPPARYSCLAPGTTSGTYLTAGQSYKEIARAINLSINTVRHYVKVLYKKFDVSNKVQLSNKLKEYVE
ncbi:MAG: helix-turn-helix transcriptional regulator [Lewinellaceae bacterium]|nr:helix-turn-helix transcriptional regulator [Lewinellaceae bacterium]